MARGCQQMMNSLRDGCGANRGRSGKRSPCRQSRAGRRPLGVSHRQEFCHFADTASPSLLTHLLTGEGGRSRMRVSPTAVPRMASMVGASLTCIGQPAGAACPQPRGPLIQRIQRPPRWWDGLHVPPGPPPRQSPRRPPADTCCAKARRHVLRKGLSTLVAQPGHLLRDRPGDSLASIAIGGEVDQIEVGSRRSVQGAELHQVLAAGESSVIC